MIFIVFEFILLTRVHHFVLSLLFSFLLVYLSLSASIPDEVSPKKVSARLREPNGKVLSRKRSFTFPCRIQRRGPVSVLFFFFRWVIFNFPLFKERYNVPLREVMGGVSKFPAARINTFRRFNDTFYIKGKNASFLPDFVAGGYHFMVVVNGCRWCIPCEVRTSR